MLDEALADDLAEVDQWYEDNLNALDETSATYETDVAALTEQAAAYKAEIKMLHTEMVGLVDSLAGQPTAVVQARMAEFADIEDRLADINAEIDATSAKSRSAAENAFRVVRSGVNADEATISQAINLKITELKLDEQSADDAYNAAVEELNTKLANKEITTTEYNKKIGSLEAERDAAKQAARDAFSKAFAEIMKGIAESEGNAEAFDKAMEAAGAKLTVQDFYDNMWTDDGTIDTSKLDAVKEKLSSIFGDAFNPEALDNLVESGNQTGIQEYLDAFVEDLSTEEIEAALGGKVGAAWAAALESGKLTGTDFDVTGTEEQLAALYINAYSNAVSTAAPVVAETGKTVGTAATSEMGDYDGAYSAGNESVNGLDSALARAEQMAYRRGAAAGDAFSRGYKDNQAIQSPSKVMQKLGQYSGEGLEIGLRESMERAALVAKQMSGKIVTAADISQSMRVANMPNLQQEIIMANEQSTQPVNLYVNGRQLGRVMAADNQQAQNAYNRSIALGVGK